MILRKESPDDYRTRPVRVRYDGQQYHVEPFGELCDFATMCARRQPLDSASFLKDDDQPFELGLANIGVSVWLQVSIKGKDYLTLVRQQRDRGDQVLKLISGYVPEEYLSNPEVMMLQEIAEEVLLQTDQGYCRFVFEGHYLPWPYNALPVDPATTILQRQQYHSTREDKFLIKGSALAVTGYIDTCVSALQLVYAYSMDVPDCVMNGQSAEDELVDGALITWLDPSCELVFAGLHHKGRLNGEFHHLRSGQLEPVDCKNALLNTLLSEAFVPRNNVFVSQSSIKVGTLVI